MDCAGGGSPGGAGQPDPDAVFVRPSPATRNSSQRWVWVFTPRSSSFLSWFLPAWLAAALLQTQVCVQGYAGRGQLSVHRWIWGWVSAHCHQVFYRAFKCQTGRDSLGKKREVFSPLREGSSLQKMAQGLLPGPGQGEGISTLLHERPALSSILSHSALICSALPRIFFSMP